jgi:hypothetical protein
MKWKNAHRDVPPKDGQTVLLSVEGIYYVTCYNASRRLFHLHQDPHEYFSCDAHTMLYWIEIDDPPVAQEVAAE